MRREVYSNLPSSRRNQSLHWTLSNAKFSRRFFLQYVGVQKWIPGSKDMACWSSGLWSLRKEGISTYQRFEISTHRHISDLDTSHQGSECKRSAYRHIDILELRDIDASTYRWSGHQSPGIEISEVIISLHRNIRGWCIGASKYKRTMTSGCQNFSIVVH